MDELASLMGPGAAALATLVVTDAVNGFKSLMRRVFPHAADTPDDHALPGELAEAVEDAAVARALGDLHHPRGRALFALHRGTVHARRADHARAEAELLAAAERFAALTPPNRFNQAKALARCAEDRRAAGRTGDALDAVALALDALAGRGGPYQAGELLLLRGTLHHESGDPAQARRDWAAARGHFTEARSVRRAREAEELLARHGGGAGT